MMTEEMLKAGPLPPFIPELRTAIRAGKKTETRRLARLEQINLNPGRWEIWERTPTWSGRGHPGSQGWGDRLKKLPPVFIKFPYQPGLKYLREPLKNVNGWAFYADDDEPVATPLGVMRWRWQVNKLSQRFMPRTAARTFVRLNSIEPARLKSMNHDDALAEGIDLDSLYVPGPTGMLRGREPETPLQAFEALWDLINGASDAGEYAWRKNPWVWVIRFRLEVLNGTKK